MHIDKTGVRLPPLMITDRFLIQTINNEHVTSHKFKIVK